MRRLLIANRGEIALRIARTARKMDIATVAVYSDVDAGAPHVRAMDSAVRIGPAPPAESYLSIDAQLAAARASGADAVHPGYGFVAESPEFAERCIAAGLTFVGPSPAAMRALGNKAHAKRLLADRGVPFLPGYHGEDQRDEAFFDAAVALEYPVMVKAAAGGGGRGMRLVTAEPQLADALRAARSEARAAFGSGDLLLERALVAPRHIEVQIVADMLGGIVHLGERDCSVQRRHQKLIEEAPAPAVDDALRERLAAVAIAVARAAAYHGAGTVEFLLDTDGKFYFIEMNARLQVEHLVTEAITNFDIVEWQLRVARGEPLPRTQHNIRFAGHAIEARLCAEDPARDFLPQAGTLVAWEPPHQASVEHALESGCAIEPYYDSMIAKFIAFGRTREEARNTLARALETCVALGVPTNKNALVAYLRDPVFAAGSATTRFIEERTDPIPGARPPEPRVVALAAALRFVTEAERGRFGSWTAWSSSRVPPATVVIALGDGPGRTIGIEVRTARDVRTNDGGDSFAIAFEPDGRRRMRARIDDGPWQRFAFATVAGATHFDFEGVAYRAVDRSAEPANRAAPGAGDGLLRAPMSGRVISVGGRAGDVLAAGTPLVALEAMKMEHQMTLPIDVTLGDVRLVAGQHVHAGDVLLAYEPAR